MDQTTGPSVHMILDNLGHNFFVHVNIHCKTYNLPWQRKQCPLCWLLCKMCITLFNHALDCASMHQHFSVMGRFVVVYMMNVQNIVAWSKKMQRKCKYDSFSCKGVITLLTTPFKMYSLPYIKKSGHGVQHVCQVQINETSSSCVIEETVLVYFYCVTAFFFEST